jgi:uncharacterized membrane protein YidH (DUF202 family)
MATNGAGLNPHVDTREYLAAERTLLAYIRTALALMGFGFIVADSLCSFANCGWCARTQPSSSLSYRSGSELPSS